MLQISDLDTTVKRLTGIFGYLFIVFANILFQGLLEIHAALDNPFGKEPGKIPMRLLVTELIRATEALLQDDTKSDMRYCTTSFTSTLNA